MINTQNYVYTKSHVNHLQFDLMHFAIFGIFLISNRQFTYMCITSSHMLK